MPYIEEKQDFDKALAPILEEISEGKSCTPGELNYIITNIAISYIERKGLSYTVINDIMGVLESSKLEFYRRIVVGYENNKMNENGDVY